MDIQVTLTLSDRLFELLEDKLPSLGKRVKRAVKREAGALVEDEVSIALTATPSKHEPENRIIQWEETPSENNAEVKAEEVPAEEAPQSTQLPEGEKKLNEVIRDIIDNTRKRIEGEDYLNNADGELYKKYHRKMTTTFKQISRELGYEKPTFIDNMEKVDAFRRECAKIIINDKGEIAFADAPY